MATTAAPDLASWIGRTEERRDIISLETARALAATLDRDPGELSAGDPLPAGWHFVYFNDFTVRSDLTPDGHARRGEFLPPVPHPHRMWAGGRLSFPGALRIGEPATRLSTIQAIEEKQGRAGPLVFVTVRNEFSHDDGVAIEEEKQLVYLTREPSVQGRPATTPPSGEQDPPDWSERFVADEVTLFRFSALTLNSHRIHYDYRYAADVEGYPERVVHGPLIALLLVDAGARHAPSGMSPMSFEYRARGPLFCGEEFHIVGRTRGSMQLQATHPQRGVATEGELELTQG